MIDVAAKVELAEVLDKCAARKLQETVEENASAIGQALGSAENAKL